MKPPPKRAILWWQRGLLDGKTAAHKRRGRYFSLYLEIATAALEPGELIGPFECVYRCAFRYGWDAEQAARERNNAFSPRPKKHVSLAKV